MANQTKAEAAAALHAAGIKRKSFSIAEFCARNGISEGFYRKLRKLGKGARELHIEDRILITAEAESDWLREREAAA